MVSIGIRPTLRLAVAALLLVLTFSAFSPHASQAQDRTDEGSSIRFVHASPDAPAIDVIVDGAAVAENAAFGTATDYVPVSSGKHQVQIVPTGTGADSAVIDEEVDLDGGGAYVFAATGLLNDLKSEMYEVDQGDLDENQARVRLINLAPDQDSVDLSVAGGDTWNENVKFPDASDYHDVDAGTYDLDVRQSDGDGVAVSVAGVTIQPDRAYDALLLGQASDALTLLTLETRVSPSCGEVLGIGTPDNTCLRILNASPESAGLDVYINDTLVTQDLTFGISTDFASIPSGGDSEVKVTAVGGSLDDALAEASIDLDSGQAYNIIALNTGDDLELTSVEVDLSPVPAGQASVQVIGASTDAPDFDVEITDGPTLFEGVGFKDSSDSAIVDASTYDLQFKDGDTVIARAESFEVEENTTYDLVLIGSSDAGTLEIVALSAPTAAIEGDSATPASTPEMGGSELAEPSTPEVVSTPAA